MMDLSSLDTHTVSLVALSFAVCLLVASMQLNLRSSSGAQDVILTRRSHTKFIAKGIPQSVVDRALNAAIHAPNHFLTEPWRFYQCGGNTIAKIAALNEDKAQALPRNMMIVTIKSKHAIDAKLGLEDLSAVSVAVQNFMLSLHAEGVATKWMTGAMGVAPEKLVDVVGAPDDERLVAAVWYGYPAEAAKKAPARKLGVAGVHTKLD